MNAYGFGIIDVGLIIIALLFGAGGFQKGFAQQVAHVATLLILGGILFTLYPVLYHFITDLFHQVDETYLVWTLLGVVLIVMLLLYFGIGKLLARLLKSQLSERSDKSLGFTLGFTRGALYGLLGMITLVLIGLPNVHDTLNERSYLGKWVCRDLIPRIQPHFTRDAFDKKMDSVRQKIEEQRKEHMRIDE